MDFLNNNASPFLLLWYLFLAFTAIVVVLQIFFLIAKLIVQWRVRTMIKRYGPKARS